MNTPPALPLAPPAVRWGLRTLMLLHVLVGAAMGLSVDEAHYLLYALHPALSYFDHPPLVGWVQWPLVEMVALGLPDAALRLLPALIWWGTVAGVYQLVRRLLVDMAVDAVHVQGVAGWALTALLLAPLLHILGIGLLPDTLLMALTVAIMAQTWRLMRAPLEMAWTPWLLLGGLLGLAGLSKYTAIFSALAVVLCLLHAHGLRLFKLVPPWGALVLALVLVLPVAVWNAQHQWVSFAYQAKHGAGGGWRIFELLRFLVVQLLVYGPLLFTAVLGWRHAPSELRPLGWFFALPFAVLAYLSGGGSSLPHWTAPAWVAAAPFAGIGLQQAVAAGYRAGLRWLGLFQALVAVGLVGLMLSAGWPVIASSDDKVAPAINPFADLHGWEQAGLVARRLAREHKLQSVAVQNWTLASRIGWYARQIPVHVLEERFDQFDLWAGDLPSGADTLLVDWSHMAYEIPMAPHGFNRCTLLETLPVQRWGQAVASFRFYACFGWEGSPQPVLTPRTSP